MSENNEHNDPQNGNDVEIVPAEKARRQYKAELELAEFARLYFARMSEEYICKTLNMSRSTYYRYLTKLGEQQHELLDEHLDASTYAEIASFRNTLRFVEVHMKQILVDAQGDDANKIEAAQLLCEVAYASVKLHTQGPVQTMKEMPDKLKKKMMKELGGGDKEQQQQQAQQQPQLVEIKTEEVVVQDNNKTTEEKKEKEKEDNNATTQGPTN